MIKILGYLISTSEIDFNSSKLYTDPEGFVGLFSIRHRVESLIANSSAFAVSLKSSVNEQFTIFGIPSAKSTISLYEPQ